MNCRPPSVVYGWTAFFSLHLHPAKWHGMKLPKRIHKINGWIGWGWSLYIIDINVLSLYMFPLLCLEDPKCAVKWTWSGSRKFESTWIFLISWKKWNWKMNRRVVVTRPARWCPAMQVQKLARQWPLDLRFHVSPVLGVCKIEQTNYGGMGETHNSRGRSLKWLIWIHQQPAFSNVDQSFLMTAMDGHGPSISLQWHRFLFSNYFVGWRLMHGQTNFWGLAFQSSTSRCVGWSRAKMGNHFIMKSVLLLLLTWHGIWWGNPSKTTKKERKFMIFNEGFS